jgi:hypothetical protein
MTIEQRLSLVDVDQDAYTAVMYPDRGFAAHGR